MWWCSWIALPAMTQVIDTDRDLSPTKDRGGFRLGRQIPSSRVDHIR